MRSKHFIAALVLLGVGTSCAALDYPLSFFDEEGNEVQTTVGDAVADNADGVAGMVSDTVGSFNPLAGAALGAAAAALLGGARRKKKAAVAAEAEKAEEAG